MEHKNLLELFKEGTQKGGEAACWRYKEKGSLQELTWNEVFQRILTLVSALRKLGVQKGDRVAILAQTSPEWSLADMAIISAGAVTVPIYQSNLADQVAYIIKNAGVKVVFAEDKNQLKKIQSIQNDLPMLHKMILFKDQGVPQKEEGIYSLEEVMLLGEGKGQKIFDEMSQTLTLESEATFVYTSGTTGFPKGAVLTHGNIITEVACLDPLFSGEVNHVCLLFLPLAHIFARVMQMGQFYYLYIQFYAESIDKLMGNIAEARPNIMGCVPRIFEKVHTRFLQAVESSSESKQKIFKWALNVGRKRYQYHFSHQSVPLILKLKWALAYKLVFSKLHEKLGGRIEFFVSSGAPLSAEIADFFYAAGLRIFEGYGLTETTGAITCNTYEDFKAASVGKTVIGAKIKIADDGEVLAKGKMVFKGYHNQPEETQKVIDEEGWFHTGDIGEIDAEGFLKITDRKKDIIVTAAGKNVAPQNIENLIKTDPLISQVMVHGDRRKYLTALITLDQDQISSYAKSHRISFQDYAALVKDKKVYHLIKSRLDEKNKKLASFETIKKFAILDTDFSIETGELTPTLKVKRKFTSEKYKDILDRLYRE